MMKADTVIQTLFRRGIALRAEAGRLVVEGSPSEPLQAYLDQNASALVAALAHEGSGRRLARIKLAHMAQEFDWPLSDLLDWFKTAEDVRTLAGMELDDVRDLVRDYLDNLELCRGEGYRPDLLIPEDNDAPAPLGQRVQCADCAQYEFSDYRAAGIGACGLDSQPIPPVYPYAPRVCHDFRPKKEGAKP